MPGTIVGLGDKIYYALCCLYSTEETVSQMHPMLGGDKC